MNGLEVFQVVAALGQGVAAIAAVFALFTWRASWRHTRRGELAEEALALGYQAVDAIRAIRSPGGWSDEGRSRKRDAEENEDLAKRLDDVNVVFERYGRHQEPIAKLHALRYRYMAVFGRDAAKPFDVIHGVMNKIFSAGHMAAMIYRDRRGTDNFDDDEKGYLKEFQRLRWTRGSDDVLEPELSLALGLLEQRCEAIRAEGWLEQTRTFFRRLEEIVRRVSLASCGPGPTEPRVRNEGPDLATRGRG